ncbi:MAG: hypothetical protein JWO84_552 [Parcubacteria group bacterium]|nr:hypothetical protein [Parcubacteria group bacterium]
MVGFFKEADSTATKDFTPMLQFLDGTIAFRPSPAHPKSWEHELVANFSVGVGPALPIFALDRLQKHCKGELDIERLSCGNIRMSRQVIAHGAESACKQAHDLRSLLMRVLGLWTNVARIAHA